ncbi:hypothetical protein ABRP58_06950 [Pectobacterium aroidearum]|uniref:hypothetical protein n=1 Tax=Pectobacterium aroidearum TaxID=1201031 RepID=UPI0032EFC402
MKIEYILMQEASSTFCNNENAISKLLGFDNEIEFTDIEKFKFNDFYFKITSKKINSDDTKKNYFTVELSIDEAESDLLAESITKLNRKLIKIFEHIFKETPKILINDLDSYYSKKAYPIIKDIENLMRQVLTKLLITKIGISWEIDSVPAEMKGKINKIKGREVKTNYLSGLDFIDLTHFIFVKYSNHNNEIIFSEIEKPIEEIDIEKLKNMIPKSNWERYLNNHMKFTEEDILIKWARLYELRCAVAHNTGFAKKDFDEAAKIVSEIKPVLISSLDSLDNRNSSSTNEQPNNKEAHSSESKPEENRLDKNPKERKKIVRKLQVRPRTYSSNNPFPSLEALRVKINHINDVSSPSEKLLESLRTNNPNIDNFKSPSDKILESLRANNPYIDDFKSPSDKLLKALRNNSTCIDDFMKLSSSPADRLSKSSIKEHIEIEVEKSKKVSARKLKKNDDDNS